MQDQTFSGNGFGLASLADAIGADRIRARAHAYLGVSVSDSKIAERHFQEAIEISEKIQDSFHQITLQAEIARFMMRASLDQKGRLLFARAEKKLPALESAARKDLALARLAEHRARALDLAKAEAHLGALKNQEILEAARKDIVRVGRTIRYMNGASQVATS
ncbi:hypothetical protein [Thiocystis violacea]|uniref:hypothetical protein n=1 Tax=Thiocystis violacea TaxID=13725 RepID=UPI0019076E5B|nr:hypothetical protein [Thiocystis violacea]MBK1718793.1 hypothetical protein [Thiocystis violacea]